MLDLDACQKEIDTYFLPTLHAGRTVGRTLYQGDGVDDLIGIVDTRGQARYIVMAVNAFPELVAEVRVLRIVAEAAKKSVTRTIPVDGCSCTPCVLITALAEWEAEKQHGG